MFLNPVAIEKTSFENNLKIPYKVLFLTSVDPHPTQIFSDSWECSSTWSYYFFVGKWMSCCLKCTNRTNPKEAFPSQSHIGTSMKLFTLPLVQNLTKGMDLRYNPLWVTHSLKTFILGFSQKSWGDFFLKYLFKVK